MRYLKKIGWLANDLRKPDCHSYFQKKKINRWKEPLEAMYICHFQTLVYFSELRFSSDCYYQHPSIVRNRFLFKNPQALKKALSDYGVAESQIEPVLRDLKAMDWLSFNFIKKPQPGQGQTIVDASTINAQDDPLDFKEGRDDMVEVMALSYVLDNFEEFSKEDEPQTKLEG